MKFEDKSYIKAISTLVSGSVIAQIFTVVCAPIITRLYSAEALGLYSLVTGAVTMFGAVMSFRYEMCIVSEPEGKKVFPLVKASFLICLCLSGLIAVGYIFYFGKIGMGSNSITMGVITGLLVLLIGIINVLTAYNNREKDYQLITKTYVQRILSQNICNVGAGFLHAGAIGLSISHVLGFTAGVYGQSKPLLKHMAEIAAASKGEVRAVLLENKKQGIYSTPATLANGLSYSLINYFIEALFSTAVVGYYSMSFRILGMPINLISTNVSRVFLEKASREYEEKHSFQKTFLWTVGAGIAFGIPLAVLMITLAPWACELFFGSGWRVAGIYISILAPMYVLRFIAGCVNSAAIIVKRQQIDLIVQCAMTAFSVVSFLIAKQRSLSVEQFLGLLNCGFSIMYVLYLFLFWRCSCGRKQPLQNMEK